MTAFEFHGLGSRDRAGSTGKRGLSIQRWWSNGIRRSMSCVESAYAGVRRSRTFCCERQAWLSDWHKV